MAQVEPYQRASCWGPEKALRRAARHHKGEKDPLEGPDGEAPSAVICCPSGEERLAAEVESARALAPTLAPNAVVLVFVPSPNLRLARAALGAGPAAFSTTGCAQNRSSGLSTWL